MKLSSLVYRARSDWTRLALSLGLGRPGIAYIAELGWVVEREGAYLREEAHKLLPRFPFRMLSDATGLKNQVLHFGSLWHYLSHRDRIHPSNRVAVTVFHADETTEDEKIRRSTEKFKEYITAPDLIVTASEFMVEKLLSWGARREKLHKIPLGVDLDMFHALTPEQRVALRKHYGIPEGHICIGSFQKDGEGSGLGLEPKRIKGPDVFVEVVKRLAQKHPIFVLLTGPARGYVKNALSSAGIPYLHRFVEDFSELNLLYGCLDFYLVTSRLEGGPKAFPECLATGTPLVTTRVGMASQMLIHERNSFVVNVDDIDGLTHYSTLLVEKPELRQQLAQAGFGAIAPYDWRGIARQYCEKVYAPLSGHA